MTMATGYYRFPTINGDSIVFVCEDDLWMVPTTGGIARRLTAGQGACAHPKFSPDGQLLAYVAREEGEPEIYVMPAEGGNATRLTFLGGMTCDLSGWSSDGLRIVFASDAKTVHGVSELYAIDAVGGMPRPLKIGHAVSIAAAKSGAMVIGRNSRDPARWKRYRGGMAGELWIDPKGRGNFNRLIELKGNLASPMWLNGKVYFLSDHEGIGNIYSCAPDGSGLRRHTHHEDYYVRYPSTDGSRIVYTCGGDVYVYDARKDQTSRVDVQMASAPRQSRRKFVPAANNIEHVSVHPYGHSIGMISRGQPFTMPFWEDAVIQHGSGSKVRYRYLEWLRDGNKFVVVNDFSGYERIEVHSADQETKPQFVTKDDIGRVIEIVVSPTDDRLAVANHKNELIIVDVEKKKCTVVDRSTIDRITGISWSPDGRWLAYSFPAHPGASNVRVLDTQGNKKHDVTRPVRQDYCTSWDPAGNFLYFLSSREFNPVYDSLQFDLSFPFGTRPYLVSLRPDVKSPFVPTVRPLVDGAASAPPATPSPPPVPTADSKKGKKKNTAAASSKAKGKAATAAVQPAANTAAPASPAPVNIDFEGIHDRVLAFPVAEGHYRQIVGVPGRALFLQMPLQVFKPGHRWWDANEPGGTLLGYDFKDNRCAAMNTNVAWYSLSLDKRTLVYSANRRLRVVDSLTGLQDTPPNPPGDDASRRTGWIDLNRAQVLIEPKAEWKQMFDESWRLQRDHFWNESMSDVDWEHVYERYASLLPRVNSRLELSDLIWEMQGELGTSHAYEFGGDHRWPPHYYRGFLGAELSYDESTGGYRIDKILRGDSWDADCDSPLARPGLGIKEGHVIMGVGGRPVSKSCSVDELLLNCSGKEVMLTISEGKGKARRVAVKALGHEGRVRYRAWVEANRKYVHDKTGGRVGYVHIPDMGPMGFAEFHRSYLSEVHRDGLIVDIRFNGGGHVSALLLEKLRRKRVGYDISRWGVPMPYPSESVAGPIVGITNQFAGSDGDIFSHCFKLYELGPLVGKRTWGGVIGIWPRHHLVDGTITTQPEFSFWFVDAGWGVENYGTEPDYEVDIAPQDYRAGRDPQMDKALELVLESLKKKPVKMPKFDQRPSLPLPKLKKQTVKR